MKAADHRAKAEAIFDGTGAHGGMQRTRAGIIGEIATALEAAHAEGLRLGALSARETALRESRAIVAGLAATLAHHDRTLEIELGAAVALKKSERTR